MKAFIYFLCVLPMGAAAVVISSGDGSGNTSAPVDDPGFDNVGKRSTAGAVYLGNRWVLTANHVGVGSVELGGVVYAVESGTAVRLQNPTGLGLTTSTDLRMYQLQFDPGLPALELAMSSPTIGTNVVMVGHGRNRFVTEDYWDVAVNPGDDTWTTAVDPLTSDVEGWRLQGTREIRWGENEVSGFNTIDLGTHGDVVSFRTTFDQFGGAAHEAQGVSGDSGGAVFFQEGGVWKLGGIMNAVGVDPTFPFDGSPPGETASNPYAYYGRATFSADLSQYRDQIETIRATPEPSSTLLLLLSGTFFLRRQRS